MALHFRWTTCCGSLPDEVRRTAELHLARLWDVLPRKPIAGTTADFRLTLADWSVRYAIDLGSHTVLLREARLEPLKVA